MGEAISIAVEVYLIAFVVGIFIAALIKGMTTVIQKISAKKEVSTERKEA